MTDPRSRYSDEDFMRRALALARRGQGRVSPNPLVGAVIVRNGRIIAEGCHLCCGQNHAEINAMERATESLAGATLYVTLEPCSHYGRTPPCVKRIIAERFGRVVVGTVDPNPLVAGKGIAALQAQGIETCIGVLDADCRRINEVFFTYIRTGLPFVTLKVAQTLDGRIATATGHSRWISSPSSLHYAHRLRASHDAILVGSGTVLADDPELTCRLVRGRNPLRIVVDSRLRTSPQRRVYSPSSGTGAIVATTDQSPADRRQAFAAAGVEVLEVGRDSQGRVDLPALLAALGRREVSSLLVEGGASVATSFLKEQLADRLVVVLAPKIVGRGIDAIGDLGADRMEDARRFAFRRVFRCGDDLILDAYPRPETPPAALQPGSRREPS